MNSMKAKELESDLIATLDSYSRALCADFTIEEHLNHTTKIVESFNKLSAHKELGLYFVIIVDGDKI